MRTQVTTVTLSPRTLVRQLVDARNSRALDRLEGMLAANVRYWDPVGRDVRGRDSVTAHFARSFARFPDERFLIEMLVADDTHAVAELAGRGTARPGRDTDFRQTEVYEVANGVLSLCHVYFDPVEHPHGAPDD
jgi:ketosteroid isomerase-like protein